MYESTQNCITLVEPSIIIMASSRLPAESVFLTDLAGLPVTEPFVLENSGVVVTVEMENLRTDVPGPGTEWNQLTADGGKSGYLTVLSDPARFLVKDSSDMAVAHIDESLILEFTYNDAKKYYTVSCSTEAPGGSALLTNQGDGSVAFVPDGGGSPASGQKWKFKKISTVVMLSDTEGYVPVE